MKYLIVGLGNPGAEYETTRHNIGFIVLDNLANEHKQTFKTERYGDVCEIRIKGRSITLLKPSTFMNLSGKAVRYWQQQLKIDLNNILVVTDDLALPPGKTRLKGKGSDGGHNGLKSIQEIVQTNQYPRLRFGVGSDFNKGQQADYVLSNFSSEEIPEINAGIEKSMKTIESFVFQGIERTMNQFN